MRVAGRSNKLYSNQMTQAISSTASGPLPLSITCSCRYFTITCIIKHSSSRFEGLHCAPSGSIFCAGCIVRLRAASLHQIWLHRCTYTGTSLRQYLAGCPSWLSSKGGIVPNSHSADVVLPRKSSWSTCHGDFLSNQLPQFIRSRYTVCC
jgi:hypothetical protein